MNKTKMKSTNTTIMKFTIFTIILSTSACSTTNKRHNLIQQSLSQQNLTLKAIKSGRLNPKIANQVAKNETLKRAEDLLLDAIDSVITSNQVIKTKLEHSKNKKGQKDERRNGMHNRHGNYQAHSKAGGVN